MTVEAYAKVNLTLEVFGVRADGYHALRSIVQPISLSDTLSIEPTDDGAVTSDTPFGEKDLIVRAAKALRAAAGDSFRACGCRVHVEKRIPEGGGLGGGSADAAATLRALNRLWNTSLSRDALISLAASVGSDVPALVLAQELSAPVLMEGRGECVAPLKSVAQGASFKPPSTTIVLANPGVHSSTPEVFARATARVEMSRIDFRLANDLQAAAIALHPEIGAALEALRVAGATNVMMSGSGASVFGFVPSVEAGESITRLLGARGLKAWCCSLLG